MNQETPLTKSNAGFTSRRSRIVRGLSVLAAAAAFSATIGATSQAGAAPASTASVSNYGTSDALYAGEALGTNWTKTSRNGAYRLIMQADGNLVLYAPGTRPLWSSRSMGSGANTVVMQSDGNLVVYAPGRAVWASNTMGSGGNRLVVQDDGNLVLYSPTRAVWASNTMQSSTYTSSRAEAAVNWMMARRGWTSYEGYCERAVENAYGTSGRFASARANWENAVARGVARRGNMSPPRGALVFWNTGYYHHVGIALGNGQFIATSVGGRIGVQNLPYYSNYLGWAPSPWA